MKNPAQRVRAQLFDRVSVKKAYGPNIGKFARMERFESARKWTLNGGRPAIPIRWVEAFLTVGKEGRKAFEAAGLNPDDFVMVATLEKAEQMLETAERIGAPEEE